MQDSQLATISNFIWNIADSVLRDLFVRGKYRDVILPMTVIRRLDAVLEPTKQKVLEEKKWLDEENISDQTGPLQQAAGQQFFNASPFTLRDLRNATSQQQLRDNFNAYLDGFSPNVQEILEMFEFRNQIARLSTSGALDALIERFLSQAVNLSPNPVENDEGEVRLPGLDNHAMGTIFEDLLRRFNEDNNEEAGEHWTPRDAVELMAKLVFLPIEDQIQPNTYLLYDGALGTGGMLTVAEQTLRVIAEKHGERISTHLYGQEINSETYAICKADLLLKGEENARRQHHWWTGTLHPVQRCLQGPDVRLYDQQPSLWEELEDRPGQDGRQKRHDRPQVHHPACRRPRIFPDYQDQRRQLLFLANMLSKMKDTPLGSRIAEVHNGSSLFTGDAGQGESNIRRWIIENDWLEAIVALPLNMFYNTGIATYVWVLTNRKPDHRKGYVQLIDATQWYTPLRRNMGQKNCELSSGDAQKICDTSMDFEETEQSKIFPNEAFGYWKVTVERPLRIEGIDPEKAHSAKEIRELRTTGTRSETAPPVIKKVHGRNAVPSPLNGLCEATIKGNPAVVEYEPDTDLRDTEQISLLHEGGIDAFLEREVLPYAPDAWYQPGQVKIGYEISFTRHFYKPKPMRTLEEIRADILALEQESEGLLEGILAR